MTNQPWECPRCKRINAPFTPTCFCNPEKGLQGLAREVLERKGQDQFKPMELPAGLPYGYKRTSECSNCGGHHGVWNNQPVECINLVVKA